MPKIRFVYIVSNRSNIHPTLYTGVTNNLKRRIQEHKLELLKGFTARYHLHNLVYYEVIEGQEQAIIREKQIKNLCRKDKFELIQKDNARLQDLYLHYQKSFNY